MEAQASHNGKVKQCLTWRGGTLSSTDMKTILLLVALGLAAQAAVAAPAPYFQWRSKLNGALACSQTPLGPGWEKSGGPYWDARCEKLIVAK